MTPGPFYVPAITPAKRRLRQSVRSPFAVPQPFEPGEIPQPEPTEKPTIRQRFGQAIEQQPNVFGFAKGFTEQAWAHLVEPLGKATLNLFTREGRQAAKAAREENERLGPFARSFVGNIPSGRRELPPAKGPFEAAGRVAAGLIGAIPPQTIDDLAQDPGWLQALQGIGFTPAGAVATGGIRALAREFRVGEAVARGALQKTAQTGREAAPVAKRLLAGEAGAVGKVPKPPTPAQAKTMTEDAWVQGHNADAQRRGIAVTPEAEESVRAAYRRFAKRTEPAAVTKPIASVTKTVAPGGQPVGGIRPRRGVGVGLKAGEAPQVAARPSASTAEAVKPVPSPAVAKPRPRLRQPVGAQEPRILTPEQLNAAAAQELRFLERTAADTSLPEFQRKAARELAIERRAEQPVAAKPRPEQPAKAPERPAEAVVAEPVPSAAATPPTVPPTKPPVATGGPPPTTPSGPDIPPYVPAPIMGKNVLGMKPIQAGLTKSEEMANIARRTVEKVGIKTVKANPLVSGAFRERARLKAVADSQSGRLGALHGTSLTRAFQLDKVGRIPSLTGLDPAVTGAPTIQDVAARLPRYWGRLSEEQRAAMLAVRRDTQPFRALLDEVGVEVPSRADVVEGGFYLPRGRADVEGADLPIKVGTGLARGGKKGFERPAVFESQAAGIDAGYVYSSIGDTLSAYARDAGSRAIDAHIANFFKSATDETGLLLGATPKMRLLEQSPQIAKQMEGLKSNLDRLKRLSAGLSKRQLEVIDRWTLDPTFDDLDVLLDGLKTMRGGAGQGMVAKEINAALLATREQIKGLAPAYKVALRRAQATPRLEGAIGTPGLQGWSFPDDIANAANIILRGEGPATGLASMPLRVANAFNNLYRGMRATLDNSALGIQGLLGAADDPAAYAKAVGVNIRAWGPGGDAALGRFIGQFDEAATASGRLSSDDWARATLRIGGAQTEFQLGAGFSTALARAPGIRQANRAFGYLGDALRLDWADDMLAAELRKGKTVQGLWDSGDVQRIADISNNMTGWAEGKAFGSMGELLLFAPRFLQSRAETLVKGVAGLRPGASIEQRAARRSLLKMMGYGAALTVAANEMLGNETDFRPFVKVRGKTTWNPNFMRVRFAGRDWSIYGTWDSFARAIVVTAMGRPQEALRGLGSGVVSDAWDIIDNRDFNGNPVRDTPAHFAKWLLESMMPFSTQSVVPTVKAGVEGVRTGDAGKIAGTGLSLGLQVLGAKSAPLSRIEQRDVRQISLYGPDVQKALDGMKKLDLSPGFVNKRFDMVPGTKGGEIDLTDEQEDAFQKLTEDTVVGGLIPIFANPDFQKMSAEAQKEYVKGRITELRAVVRDRFRATLQEEGAPDPTESGPPKPTFRVPVAPTRVPPTFKEKPKPTFRVPAGAR